MTNLPPGVTDGDIDRSNDGDDTCGNCGVRMIDCRCDEPWVFDRNEYYCEFDDEGD